MDAHAKPPDGMRLLFKKWQKCSISDITQSSDIMDFSNQTLPEVESSGIDCDSELERIYNDFLHSKPICLSLSLAPDIHRYEVKALPGLFVYPSLLPRDVQAELLNKLLHRDLISPVHQTNLNLHYSVPYPNKTGKNHEQESFFGVNPNTIFHPKDHTIHKPLTMQQVLSRKLRWITLGGQYDWTMKVYPAEDAPNFPPDIGHLLRSLFPNVDAQAAIVNLYTPGDTLSVHRDVSEECDRGLVSVSIGCDGIFIIGNDDCSRSVTIRLKSGDALLMSGQSRFAWHAVPRILAGTCPEWLQQWPCSASDSTYSNWDNWMANKRINLNVRQMKA